MPVLNVPAPQFYCKTFCCINSEVLDAIQFSQLTNRMFLVHTTNRSVIYIYIYMCIHIYKFSGVQHKTCEHRPRQSGHSSEGSVPFQHKHMLAALSCWQTCHLFGRWMWISLWVAWHTHEHDGLMVAIFMPPCCHVARNMYKLPIPIRRNLHWGAGHIK